jgi:putative copper resistance protein D
MGLLALVAQAGKVSRARNWPLAIFGLSAFLFLRNDPEMWPLGPIGFWATHADPEVLLHRFFAVLVIALRYSNGACRRAALLLAEPGWFFLCSSRFPAHCCSRIRIAWQY